eukprot:CAMPEP_0114226928 /NCGR_PEP_ID=MMETSP0058-20121206/1507_1 /TAXON_ID=36894 /ORGANISM="Pyramimonas parkeae, CCMP726" /LENGTH=190 /DNA_ID=CAMNT_0001337713 /DNA_START=156 /DNA_END=728 /DNA_ORIENTATION=-
MTVGKCINEGCTMAKHSYIDYKGACCGKCKPGKDKHAHECEQRGPCNGEGCTFFRHSTKYQHGFCCDKCELGKGHGPMCEKLDKAQPGDDAAPEPPNPAKIEGAEGKCKNPDCSMHVHTTMDHNGYCCASCKKGGKEHAHHCEQRSPCMNSAKCGFFRHSVKYGHGSCCDVCENGGGGKHGPMCEKVSIK